jgi:hypothetical protein
MVDVDPKTMNSMMGSERNIDIPGGYKFNLQHTAKDKVALDGANVNGNLEVPVEVEKGNLQKVYAKLDEKLNPGKKKTDPQSKGDKLGPGAGNPKLSSAAKSGITSPQPKGPGQSPTASGKHATVALSKKDRNHYLRLRAMVDAVAKQENARKTFKLETAPQPVKKKQFEEDLQKGKTDGGLGTMKNEQTVKKAGLNAQPSSSVFNTYKKWEDLCMEGSLAPDMPKPTHS